MTDERQGEALWPALRRLPPGSGVVFRHYGFGAPERRTLFMRVRRLARARGLLLLLADSPRQARAWGADGAHGRHGRRTGQLRSMAVHDQAELRAARDADLVFISPVFATRSHAGATGLGVAGFLRLMQDAAMPAIALGGMNYARGKRLIRFGAYGWAAIDALTPSAD
jgi:thiamine-phosphate pyrophosphorylase